MKRIFIGLLLLCSVFLKAQNNAIQNALKNFEYETAIHLISKEKATPELNYLKATCFKNIARYNDAITLLEEHKDLANVRAVNELAECYQLKGNYPKAKLYYFMALQ